MMIAKYSILHSHTYKTTLRRSPVVIAATGNEGPKPCPALGGPEATGSAFGACSNGDLTSKYGYMYIYSYIITTSFERV